MSNPHARPHRNDHGHRYNYCHHRSCWPGRDGHRRPDRGAPPVERRPAYTTPAPLVVCQGSAA